MPVISLEYSFRVHFRIPASAAFGWCTDFGPEDGPLFAERTRRSIRRLNEDSLIMTDTTYPNGRPRRVRRLVRLFPSEWEWTSTHLDGPHQYSQFWYRIVSDGPRRSHLEFRGLHLESLPRRPSASEVARLALAHRNADSGEWISRLAPALERDVRARLEAGD